MSRKQAGAEPEADTGAETRECAPNDTEAAKLADLRQAIADANAFLEHYGLWSDGRRPF